jgi:hypothetical protein
MPADESKIIARRSDSALWGHFALAVLGLLTPLLVFRFGTAYPAFLMLTVVAVPSGALSLLRTLHAFRVPHAIESDASGVRFVWGAQTLGVPWLRREVRRVEWEALRGLGTSTFSFNGLATTSLEVTTADGVFEVPDRRLDRSAVQIQRDLLDRLDRLRGSPASEASSLALRCRERFAVPMHLVARLRRLAGMGLFFGALVALSGWLVWATPCGITIGLCSLMTFLTVTFVGYELRGWHRERVLELRADGLAIGPDASRARVIPWESIRLVRRVVVNSRTTGIEVIEENGHRTSLWQDYGLPFDELCRLIDPSEDADGK